MTERHAGIGSAYFYVRDVDALYAELLEMGADIQDEREIWRNLRDRFPSPYTEADADEWVAIATARAPITTTPTA